MSAFAENGYIFFSLERDHKYNPNLRIRSIRDSWHSDKICIFVLFFSFLESHVLAQFGRVFLELDLALDLLLAS